MINTDKISFMFLSYRYYYQLVSKRFLLDALRKRKKAQIVHAISILAGEDADRIPQLLKYPKDIFSTLSVGLLGLAILGGGWCRLWSTSQQPIESLTVPAGANTQEVFSGAVYCDPINAYQR